MKLEDLRDQLKRAKEGLRNSVNFGTWKRVVDAGNLIPLSVHRLLKHPLDLKFKLDSVSRAHYSSGEGCLEGTRMSLLANVDAWVRGSGKEKTAWVHGHAGSGKSALLNSIAEKLEGEGVPFICFPCKRDDPGLSNIHQILTTISYSFTECYGDYRGSISNIVDQPTGRSVSTGDVKKQSELLFGKTYELIFPKRANRPSIHVILIDAIDECRSHRNEGKTADERRALLHFLIGLADAVPWIKVLITGRPEPEIVDTFTDTTSAIHRIDISDEEWETPAEIRLYVEAQSAKLKLGLSPDQVERFQAKAFGLFIWCSTVFRFIQESRERSGIVDDILKDSPPDEKDDIRTPLYNLYQRVLASAVSRLHDRKLMESILSIIFVTATHQPLSAEAITDVLYPSEGDGLKRKRDWVKNVIRSLFAIIYVEEGTGFVRACHPSVLDFAGGMLTGNLSVTTLGPGENTAKPFSLRLEEIHARVFNGCFTIMDRDLRFNICELEDSFRLNKDVLDLPARISENLSEALQYGSLFWFRHFEKSGITGSEEKVLAFLSSLKTLFWVETLSLLDVIDKGIVLLQDCARFFAVRPSFRNVVRLLTNPRLNQASQV